eukprot:Gb_30816 [translate_table: standard]
MLHLPKHISEIQVPSKELEFLMNVPRLLLILTINLPTALKDRSDPYFDLICCHSSGVREANGILINTFEELERQSIKDLVEVKIMELALGLEASEKCFVWVLCNPPLPNSSYVTISQLLPRGFESGRKDRALVVSSWAPQIPILAHPSTGGSLSHYKWNLMIDNISHGILMIASPIAIEQ